jgi:hypothetical protein
LRGTENLLICERGVALYSVHATTLIRSIHKPAAKRKVQYKYEKYDVTYRSFSLILSAKKPYGSNISSIRTATELYGSNANRLFKAKVIHKIIIFIYNFICGF